MSTYHGRRGPNVSHFLRDLNAVGPETTQEDEAFKIEEDLAMFTNTQFFDFESGQNTDFQAHPLKPTAESTATSTTNESDTTSPIGDLSSLDFISTDFNFPDFPPYSAGIGNYPDTINLQPIQPNQAVYNPAPSYMQQQPPQPQHHQSVAPRIGEKRNSESMASPDKALQFEDTSRQAAEEDKRRRNTAASARFRVKKKQREQALEKSAKEMSEKVALLESRIHELETENKWLKNMVLEKNGGSNDAVKTSDSSKA